MVKLGSERQCFRQLYYVSREHGKPTLPVPALSISFATSKSDNPRPFHLITRTCLPHPVPMSASLQDLIYEHAAHFPCLWVGPPLQSRFACCTLFIDDYGWCLLPDAKFNENSFAV